MALFHLGGCTQPSNEGTLTRLGSMPSHQRRTIGALYAPTRRFSDILQARFHHPHGTPQ